jgi:hypothetical protein
MDGILGRVFYAWFFFEIFLWKSPGKLLPWMAVFPVEKPGLIAPV